MKRGDGERLALAVVIVSGLIGLLILLWSSGIIDLSGGITGRSVEEINLPPEFTGTDIATAQNAAITIDLSTQFSDPEGQALTFIVAEEDVITVSIDESIVTFTPDPDFVGERTLTIVATDGENVVRVPVKLTVAGTEAPVEQTSEPVPEPVVQEEPAEPEPPAEESGGFGGQGFTTQDTCGTCAACQTCMSSDGAECSLTADISSAATCIAVTGSNTFLNCTGFTIGFNTDGSNSVDHGINISHESGVTINDCIIRDLSSTGGSSEIGITLLRTNGTIIQNTTVYGNGTGQTFSGNNDNRTFIENSTFIGEQVFFQSNGERNNITNSMIINATLEMDSRFSFAAFNMITNGELSTQSNGAGTLIFMNNVTRISTLNNIRGIDTDPAGPVIYIGNRIVVETNGTGAIGFRIASSTVNITNNTIIVNGSRNARGITVEASSTVRANFTNITVNGNGTAIDFDFAVTNVSLFENTIFHNTPSWINGTTSTPTSLVNFTNTTFVTTDGSIRYPGFFQYPVHAEINRGKLNISSNVARLNSSNVSFLNTSAQITLNGITASNPDPLVDFDDDGTFAACPSTICEEISFSGGTFIYNVTQFTTYSSSDANLTTCQTINSSANLAQNLISNDTCITIGADDIELDCAGFNISFNSDGGNSEFGVVADGRTNVTIRDCFIEDVNLSNHTNYPVNFSHTNNSFVLNSTLIANHSNFGGATSIRLLFSNDNNIANNTILAFGQLNSIAIDLDDSHNNTLFGNIATSNGTADTVGLTRSHDNELRNSTIFAGVVGQGIDLTWSNYTRIENNTVHANSSLGSIFIQGQSQFTRITDNIILNNRTGNLNAGQGIRTSDINTINITGNRITVNSGTIASAYGIQFGGTSNARVIRNTIFALGNSSGNSGIFASTSTFDSVFDGNNITTRSQGSSQFAPGILFNTANRSTFNNTIIDSPFEWINLTRNSQNHNFTNTTFVTDNGSITIISTVELNTSTAVNKSNLNVSDNVARVDSVDIPFFNTSARILLRGVTFSDPEPTIDFDDDGTFAACPGGICTEVGFSGGDFIFDVTQFTQFSSQEGPPPGTFGTLTINSSTTLTQNVTSNGTGVVIGNSSLFLNCSGFTITYGDNGIENDTMGINVSNAANVTIKDCILQKGNTTGGSNSYGIGLVNATDVTIVNNTILTNGSGNNDGINAKSTLSGTNVLVTNDGNINNPFCPNSTSGINFCSPCMNNVDCSQFLQDGCSEGDNIKTDTILRFNVTSQPTGGVIKFLGGEGINCELNDVNIASFGTNNNCGSIGQFAIAANRFILNAENNLTCSVQGWGTDEDNGFKMFEFSYSVELDAASNALIENNTIIAAGGNQSDGIFFELVNSTIKNNTITTLGVVVGHGINMPALGVENNITLNVINATTNISDAIRLKGNALNILRNNSVASTGAGIHVENALNNIINRSIIDVSLTGTSLFIAETSGEINYTQQLNVTEATRLDSVINISFNNTLVNTSNVNGSQFNVSATLRFFNLQFPQDQGGAALRDPEDDASFVGCLDPQCTQIDYNQSSGLLEFDVASFTSHAGTPVSTCSSLDLPVNQTNATFELLNNVSTGINNTCFSIIAENITLNCNGFKINGSVNLGEISGIGTGTGINVSNTKNVVIRDCIIEDFYVSLAFQNVTNSAITNVSSFNSTEEGIFLHNSHNNTVENNTAYSNRSQLGNQRASPFTLTGSNDNVLINNSANTSIGRSSGKFAIALETTSDNNVLKDNVVFDSDLGLSMLNADNNTLINNSVYGTSAFTVRGSNNVFLNNFGFARSADAISFDINNNNIVRNNTLILNSTSTGRAVEITEASNSNIIENNNITGGSTGDTIFIAGGSSNIIANNTIITSLSGRGIRMEVFEFIIETFTNGSWYNVTTVDLVRQRGGYRYDVENVTLPAGTTNVRLTHHGTDTAHLDFVLLDDAAPLTVLDNETGSQQPAKLAAADYDVIDAVKRTIELTWAIPGATLAIGGVEENLNDIAPYSWPRDVNNFTYTIGDSELRTIDWSPTSAHPNGTIYLDFSTTATELHVNVDMTPDNTLDPGGDWMEIRIINPVLKEFRINTTDFTWGTHAYEYTDKVVWQHKTYNFTIPLSEMGVSSGDEIEYRLGYYGTGGGDPCDSNVIINNTIVVNTGVGISAGDCGSLIITNNNITTNSSDAIDISSGDSATILFNNITSITGHGIDLSSASDNHLIGNNTIKTGSGLAISISSNSWPETIMNNSLRSDNSTVLGLTGPTHVVFGNTLSTNIGTPLVLTTSANNIRIQNTTIFTNGTVWIDIQTTNNNTNFTNTLFEDDDGSIRVLSQVSSNGAANVTRDKLNVTFNNAFMNSTNLSFLNASTQIILRSLQFIDPFPVVDLEDDNTFANCFPARCTEETIGPGNNFVFGVTGFTSYQATEGNVNLTLAKTDSPDPVNSSLQLNYSIDVNNTGTSEALNITVTDTYPPQVIFLSASPAPVSGTNNTFFIGNLSPQYNFTLNISVFVVNLSNGTVINNTVNITFLNQSNSTLTANVTESTTVITPIPFNFTNLSVTKADSPDPVENDTFLNYTITVTANGAANGTAFNVTVNETYPPELIFISASPTPLAGTNNTFILGNLSGGTSAVINITLFVTNLSNSTIINNTVNVTANNETGALLRVDDTESTTVQNSTGAPAPPPPAAAPGQGGGGGGASGGIIRRPEVEAPAETGTCVESWACEGWGRCENGIQSRICVDISQCATEALKPATQQACAMPVVAAPEPEPEPEPFVPAVLPKPELAEPQPYDDIIQAIVMAVALLALAVFFIVSARSKYPHLAPSKPVKIVKELVKPQKSSEVITLSKQKKESKQIESIDVSKLAKELAETHKLIEKFKKK